MEKYSDVIISKTHRTRPEFEKVLSIIKSKVRLIPMEDYTNFMPKAESVSPDINDSPYFAISFMTGAVV